MGGMADRDAFIRMLSEQYPAVAAEIDETFQGLLHLEMATLVHAVQAAINDGDSAAVRDHFRFIDAVYRHATPEVKNAVHVLYLENLDFDGKDGKRIKAREMLSPALEAALTGLEEYNAELFRPSSDAPGSRSTRGRRGKRNR
jgi:hypothetical protein